ncbi:WGR domain-containing protein [Rhizobium beringeri]|uniref:WGR domain-containing protein n=1 Tax=Rhizobium beringeri TaxID=3019934 RepID=UPI003B5B5E49
MDGQLVSAHDPIMDTTADIMLLYRIDPSRNMARFYRLSIQPTLFGGSSLVRNWGRIGTEGRLMVELYDTPEEADTACERMTSRKLRRGYRYDGATCFAQEIVTAKGAKTASADFVEPATPAEWSPGRTIYAQGALEFPESTPGQPQCLGER